MSFREAIVSTIGEIFQTALISLGIFLFVYVFLVQPHRVQGVSMEPTFENGELLLTEKISFRVSKVERGDVVVFEAPLERKADFIKRVIGLPGETVEISNNGVIINGAKIDEYYTAGLTLGSGTIKVGQDEFFVMGDNRSASSDSRSFGPIKKSSLKGKVWLVYWPLFKRGTYEGARFVSDVKYSVSN